MKFVIDKLIYGGFGLGFSNEKPFFVRKTVPGDKIEIKIIKDKKSYSEAIIQNIVTPGKDRVVSPCKYFSQCGGCDHQNISYADQLKYKNNIFKEVLTRAKITTVLEPIIAGSNHPIFYRNSIRFFIIHESNGNILFARTNYLDSSKFLPVDSCLLQSVEANQILYELKKCFNNISNKKHLWQLKIRQGKFTNEFMIEIISSFDHPFDHNEKRAIIESLSKINGVKSIYLTTAPAKSLKNLRRNLIYGSPIIYEKIGHYKFQISPESFFQTNSMGVKTLYDIIKKYANVCADDTIIDLYCGTGSIGIYLSAIAKKVIGVELVNRAVMDAIDNAKINKISNIEFIHSDINKIKNNVINKFGQSIIVIDPPRAGLDKNLIKILSSSHFKRLIYVSCNPATFARDIKIFESYGCVLKKVIPIDMFPQTHHIECVGEVIHR